MAMLCVSGGRECMGCMQCQKEPDPFYCPICYAEVGEHVYKADGEIIGCESCVDVVSVDDIERE